MFICRPSKGFSAAMSATQIREFEESAKLFLCITELFFRFTIFRGVLDSSGFG